MIHSDSSRDSLISLGGVGDANSSGLKSGERGEFASGYSLEELDQSYNLTKKSSKVELDRGGSKGVLNIDIWNDHVEIRDIAESLQYNLGHDYEQFWQRHSTKTGLKRVLTAIDSISILEGEIDSGLAVKHLNDVENFAYSLIEYELSGILDDEYEDWPERRASYDQWPAAQTLDFIRQLPEDSVEYEAYKHVREKHLEEIDPIPDSEFPDIDEIMPTQ